jgi:hypothetical protein
LNMSKLGDHDEQAANPRPDAITAIKLGLFISVLLRSPAPLVGCVRIETGSPRGPTRAYCDAAPVAFLPPPADH